MLSKIEWNGKVPSLGESVFTTIKIDGYNDISNWSIKITNIKNIGKLATVSEIEFLMNEIAPTKVLTPNTQFDVLLGANIIGHGKIVARQEFEM